MESEPLPSLPATDVQDLADEESGHEDRKLPIRTYHCRFCSHLLIASTRELLSLSAPLRRRRRIPEGGAGVEGGEVGVGGLDGALILELPSSSRTSRTSRTSRVERISHGDEQNEERRQSIPDIVGGEAIAAAQKGKAGKGKRAQAHYTIPLSTLIPDSTPVVIRREDGFEKRVLLRCGRCRVVVGYNLALTTATDLSADHQDIDIDIDIDIDEDEDEDEEVAGLRKGGKGKERAIYLLPGSIVGTEDLDVGLEPGGASARAGAGGGVLNAMIERNTVLKGMEGEWMEWIK